METVQVEHTREHSRNSEEQCRRNIYGISEGGTFMETAQEDFYGKGEDELHGNSALGKFMGTEQEDYS